MLATSLRLLFLVAWLETSMANQATIQEIPHKLVRFPLVGLQNTTTVESVTAAQIGIGKPAISVVELDETNTEGTTDQILVQTLLKLDSELRASQNNAPNTYVIPHLIVSTVFLSFVI